MKAEYGLEVEGDKALTERIIRSGVRSFVFQNIPMGREDTVGRKKARSMGELGMTETAPATSSPLGTKRGEVEER